jgi:hypothetical protein
MRNRIALAVSLLKEAAAALLDMPLLLLFPVLETVAMALFTGLWLTYAVYLVSSADIVSVYDPSALIEFKKLHWSQEAQARIAFLFFCWVWTSGFMQSMGYVS